MPASANYAASQCRCGDRAPPSLGLVIAGLGRSVHSIDVPRRIVLLGATGYTGRLVADALVRNKARPVLAGRSSQNLAALGVQLGKGLDTAVVDVRHPETLIELLEADDVLVSTVGPFEALGRPVIEAAVQCRATYLDSCSEPAVLRSVYEEVAPEAEAAGVVLVPGCGFEFVVGNLAAWLALESAGNLATGVEVGYFVTGHARSTSSVGARASAGAAALAPHFTWPIAVGALEHLAIPRMLPAIREVSVYMGGPKSERVARAGAQLVGAAARLPGVPAMVRWVSGLPRSKDGPDETERASVSGFVTATAHDAAGRELRTVRLGRVNPYTFTGNFLAWAAMRAARDGIAGAGAVGPVEAFGLRALVEGCVAAGVKAAI
ncbi:MAG: saccharopine dehydrogenase [Chloroflexi bacterium]|nr:MAG: saccharopine dehydrogenase [Chloroflexota bacterium]